MEGDGQETQEDASPSLLSRSNLRLFRFQKKATPAMLVAGSGTTSYPLVVTQSASASPPIISTTPQQPIPYRIILTQRSQGNGSAVTVPQIVMRSPSSAASSPVIATPRRVITIGAGIQRGVVYSTPESVEKLRVVTPSSSSSNGILHNSASLNISHSSQSSGSCDSPVQPVKRSRIAVISDSDEDQSPTHKKPHREDTELTRKENSLRVLWINFPFADYMELQDALVLHQWNADKASDYLRTKYAQSNRLPAMKHKNAQVSNVTVTATPDFDSGPSNGAVSRPSGSDIESSDPNKKPRPSMNMNFKVLHKKRSSKYIPSDGSLNIPKSRKNAEWESDEDYEEDEDGHKYGGEQLYDSDDSDTDQEMTTARMSVYEFFQKATREEMLGVPSCSAKKVDAVIQLRPFKSWPDMVGKFTENRTIGGELLNKARDLLNARDTVTRLMNRCAQIAEDMEDDLQRLMHEDIAFDGCLVEQPRGLCPTLKLAPYQLLGVNWLLLLHRHKVNGILADEMGLGKTVQTIAFLTQMKETGNPGPHLVVCPTSTLDNWVREINTWSPSMGIVIYHGSINERKDIRLQLIDGELDPYNIIVATYASVQQQPEDRALFKRLEFQYVIFDEAHYLKNMRSQRYQHLMKLRAKRRLLLTGTPLQNNLVELMSLLVFVMPNMFTNKADQVVKIFSAQQNPSNPRGLEHRSKFEQDQINHAKQIMRPFILRRLKKDVLQQLPNKIDLILPCKMSERQTVKYQELIKKFSEELKKECDGNEQAPKKMNMMMQLRRAANHPLLIRSEYDDEKLVQMAQTLIRDPVHPANDMDRVMEEFTVMSDYHIHTYCKRHTCLHKYLLSEELILDSGKLEKLDEILAEMKTEGVRGLVFSQFTMVLDVLEDYLTIREYKYLRLDGQTAAGDRQEMIDQFNVDDEIFVFLLSTRAGGLGINLTAASKVIIHDIDFNPYNDKQAEDRCHRVGQTKEVTVMRLLAKDTIENGIWKIAQDKLRLEEDISAVDKNKNEEDISDVATLLKQALGLT